MPVNARVHACMGVCVLVTACTLHPWNAIHSAARAVLRLPSPHSWLTSWHPGMEMRRKLESAEGRVKAAKQEAAAAVKALKVRLLCS